MISTMHLPALTLLAPTFDALILSPPLLCPHEQACTRAGDIARYDGARLCKERQRIAHSPQPSTTHFDWMCAVDASSVPALDVCGRADFHYHADVDLPSDRLVAFPA